jgi:nucleoside-diphosphate-sugar epimerase
VTTYLVIGGTGLVGSALVNELNNFNRVFGYTSRRGEGPIKFDLETSHPNSLPDAGVVFLVAAMPGFAVCESNRLTWLINVDAQIALARRFARGSNITPAFVVYVSSEAVEIAGATAYARQKAAVESFIHTIDGAIVRPARIAPDRARDFARFLIKVGDDRRTGVYRWMG